MNRPQAPSMAIDYDLFTKRATERGIDRAKREIIRDAMMHASKYGLPGNHHFYICFDTHHDGVVMPDFLRAMYPSNMTIVLQHRFFDLQAGEEGFSVTLSFQQKLPRISFQNQLQRLTIPYPAILEFTDPAAAFRLVFAAAPENGQENGQENGKETAKSTTADNQEAGDKTATKKQQSRQEQGDDPRVVHVNFPRRGIRANPPKNTPPPSAPAPTKPHNPSAPVSPAPSPAPNPAPSDKKK